MEGGRRRNKQNNYKAKRRDEVSVQRDIRSGEKFTHSESAKRRG